MSKDLRWEQEAAAEQNTPSWTKTTGIIFLYNWILCYDKQIYIQQML